MRRAGHLVACVALLAGLASAAVAAAEPAAPAVPTAQAPPRPAYLPTPFGPGYDTLRDAPVEPATAGKGLESATLVVAGHAEVEELRDEKAIDPAALYGVVLDVRIAPASTTESLDEKTVSLKAVEAAAEAAAATAPWALCLPSAGAPISVYRGAGMGLGDWNIAVGEQRLHCGGRNMRMGSILRGAGLRVTTSPTTTWQGPLVLLFAKEPAGDAELKLGSLSVKVPAPAGKPGAKAPAGPGPAPAGH